MSRQDKVRLNIQTKKQLGEMKESQYYEKQWEEDVLATLRKGTNPHGRAHTRNITNL